jgi:ethanolamine ammonia-lyase small subunit
MNQYELRTQIDNPWESLKQYTQARIAIGRCGTSIPTKELLDFKLCHARAIDAVHIPLNTQKVVDEIEQISLNKVLLLHSAASGRSEYLCRPDLGRKLSVTSATLLDSLSKKRQVDIALVVADGLSSFAVEKNIVSMLVPLIHELRKGGYTLAPITVVEQGRVAIADEIAERFSARMSVIFIGERPGLKAPDSLGIYLTFDPRQGTTDERRNCISNVRTEGLAYNQACSKLMYLINEAFRRQLSGVDLKDEQENRILTPSESLQISYT